MTAIKKYLQIAKMVAGNAIVDITTGAPTTAFLRQINDGFGNTASVVNGFGTMQDDIVFSLGQAGIAITDAATAHTLALAAGKEASLVNSYVTPATVLSAKVSTTDSTKADIVIADHRRVYGDGTSVAVTGTTLHGLNLASTYFVTYLDAGRVGGVESYLYTTNYLTAGQGLNQHLVGSVDTPASATAPPTVGGGTPPAGTGGSGGLGCVTIDTYILMANETLDGAGEERLAGDLRKGDYLWTQHNETMLWGAYPISAIRFYNRSDVMSAAGYPDATPEHPYRVDDRWSLMLWIGSGAKTSMICKMTVEDAHTYMSRHPDSTTAVLSHNKLAEPTNA